MKKPIICLTLVFLFGIIFTSLFAQQNQNTSQQEIEALKKQLSEIQSKLQAVENIEKMELAAKLAEAETKLINTEFGKLKLELKDSNQQWLITWLLIFLGILSVVGYALWTRLTKKMDDLIKNEVEERVNSFQESVEQVRILAIEHAAAVLEGFINSYIGDEHSHSEQIKIIREDVLLEIFYDKSRYLPIRDKAVEVLAARKSKRLVFPVLEFLNSVIDSDIDADLDWDPVFDTRRCLNRLVNFVGKICTDESYQGLKRFLNRLLTENPKHKNMVLMSTVLSFARISEELIKMDSVSILKKSMSHFDHPAQDDLRALAIYFDRLDEPASIKDILTEHVTSGMPDVENTCMELLQKHDPDFVKNWKAQKEITNTKNEESS